MYEALQDYIKNSELRIADENLCIRMSPDLAQKYDAGVYDAAVAEHVGCVRELMALDLLPDKSKKFYIYLIPDGENVPSLLNFPYKDAKRGGCPVTCFDKDGLKRAYGVSESTFYKACNVRGHVMKLHEFVHLVQTEYKEKHQLISEGIAELVPWYLLDYDNQDIKGHVKVCSITDIYAATNLLGIKDVFLDRASNSTASFQKSYISAYVFMRTVVEKMEAKYSLDKVRAVKLLLQWIAETKLNSGLLVMDFATRLGLNAEKLLYTTEYQKEVLQKMANVVKMNQDFIKPGDSIKR